MRNKFEPRKIIEALGKANRIYLSEAQFQFELAWRYYESLTNEEREQYEILLEYTACAKKPQGTKKRKRFESDIIIRRKNDGKYIVIELKYKTKEANKDEYGIPLIQQAGQLVTKYDYLFDIHRIELLKNQEDDDGEYEYYLDSDCLGGYAIFLTNDPSYWKEPNRDTLAKDFAIWCGAEIKKDVELNWHLPPGEELKDWMKSRETFELKNDYTFKWDTYCYSKDGKKSFKYLVTEI